MRFAGVLIILAIFSGIAFAEGEGYRFDDLYGPSGKSWQWMVINTGTDTFGADHQTAIDISSDLILSDSGVVDVINGTPNSTIFPNRSLSTLFLVLSDGYGEFSMDIHSPRIRHEATTNDVKLGSSTSETNAPYTASVTATGPVSKDGYDSQWSNYIFTISRQTGSLNRYDTIRQTFNYQQNPSDTSSQGINKPVVIANVVNGTATDEALELRMTLRDRAGNGNIVAYRHDKWNAQNSKETTSANWVLAPVENLNVDTGRINYHLTTEIVNHTAVRYGAQDANSNWLTPTRWKFDLPRYQGTTDIERYFFLDNASHAAPGLVTVYTRSYNLNEQNIRPLRIFAIDDDMRNGMWDLVLNHDTLFVKKIGETYEYGTESSFRQIEITAFEPNPSSLTFYDEIALVTGGTKGIGTPSAFYNSSISRTIPIQDALEYFTINHSIPNNLRTSTQEVLLPVLVTMNIPVTAIKDRSWWNNLVTEYRNNGQIEYTFAQNLSIYLMAEDRNILNLTEELDRLGVYSSQVKVFLDEERGRATNDNDKGVITISFVMYLMNGTRDGVRPELSMVYDNSRGCMVVRDGSEDSNLNMQVFIAPSSYYHNPEVTPTPTPSPTPDYDDDPLIPTGGGGGGGFNAGFSLLCLSTILFAYNFKKERKI